MSNTGPLTAEQLTDEVIINSFSPIFREKHLPKYSDEDLKTMIENVRELRISDSMHPQRYLDLRGWGDTPEYEQIENNMIKEKLIAKYPDLIKNRLGPDSPGKEKAYLIYIYEQRTDIKQKDLCNVADISSRQYRDLRDKYKEELIERSWEDTIITDVYDELDDHWTKNKNAFLQFVDHLKILGIENVDEWGDYKQTNDTIDNIIQATRTYSGPA